MFGLSRKLRNKGKLATGKRFESRIPLRWPTNLPLFINSVNKPNIRLFLYGLGLFHLLGLSLAPLLFLTQSFKRLRADF